ncbi:MAG TPA: lactonase family protein [Verrucomicrobiota bacterium]|nr:lactonase family protein [Verrucomicrobiota bacterium]HNU49702.1 lactonase family protein [Verrucomicrobiota bacterium]
MKHHRHFPLVSSVSSSIVTLGLACAVLVPQAAARSCLVYLGTYTGQRSQGIYVFPFDTRQGKAGSPTLAAETTQPSFLALHPNGNHLYAVGETGQGKTAGAVSAFTINRATGALSLQNRASSGGAGPCHLIVHPDGKWVFVANYGGGSVAVLPLRQDGALGEPATVIQHQGSSVNRQRQEGPHAHGVTLDQSGQFLFVPDLGLDKILVYRFDAATGALTPHAPPSAAVKPGAGPRHFAFAPDYRHAYVINELDSTITAFAYDPRQATLTEQQTVTTLPEGFGGKSTTAEILVHPSGRFLYGSNRGYDSLAVFAVDRAKGTLKPLQHVSTQGQTPRSFGIDPTGEWLWAANQNSDTLVLFRIDPNRGRLLPTGESLNVGSPVCVQFLPLD